VIRSARDDRSQTRMRGARDDDFRSACREGHVMASGARRVRPSRSTANGRAETGRACVVRPSSHVTPLLASGNFDPFTQH